MLRLLEDGGDHGQKRKERGQIWHSLSTFIISTQLMLYITEVGSEVLVRIWRKGCQAEKRGHADSVRHGGLLPGGGTILKAVNVYQGHTYGWHMNLINTQVHKYTYSSSVRQLNSEVLVLYCISIFCYFILHLSGIYCTVCSITFVWQL